MKLYSVGAGLLLASSVGIGAGIAHELSTHDPIERELTTGNTATTSEIILSALTWINFRALIAADALPAYPADEYVVVDLRDPDAFARNHIPGAVNIQPEHVVAEIGGLAPDTNQPILLYGDDATQSIRSLVALRLFAYHNVVHVDGGWPVLAQRFATDRVAILAAPQ